MDTIEAVIGGTPCVLVEVGENVLPNGNVVKPQRVTIPAMATMLEFSGLKMVRGLNTTFAFELPAHNREVIFLDERLTVPVPNLVFLWDMTPGRTAYDKLRVFTRSSLDVTYSRLNAFQVGNVWSNGKICFGGHGQSTSLMQAITYFLSSPFNHHLEGNLCFIKPEILAKNPKFSTAQSQEPRRGMFRAWSKLSLADVTDYPVPVSGRDLTALMNGENSRTGNDQVVRDQSVLLLNGVPYRAMAKDSFKYVDAITGEHNKVLVLSEGNKFFTYPCKSTPEGYVAVVGDQEIPVNPQSIFVTAECYKVAAIANNSVNWARVAQQHYSEIRSRLTTRKAPVTYVRTTNPKLDIALDKAIQVHKKEMDNLRAIVLQHYVGTEKAMQIGSNYINSLSRITRYIPEIDAFLGQYTGRNGGGEQILMPVHTLLLQLSVHKTLDKNGNTVNKLINEVLGDVVPQAVLAINNWGRQVARAAFSGLLSPAAHENGGADYFTMSTEGPDTVYTGATTSFRVPGVCRTVLTTRPAYIGGRGENLLAALYHVNRDDIYEDDIRNHISGTFAGLYENARTANPDNPELAALSLEMAVASPMEWRGMPIPQGSRITVYPTATPDDFKFAVTFVPEGAVLHEKLQKAITRASKYMFKKSSRAIAASCRPPLGQLRPILAREFSGDDVVAFCEYYNVATKDIFKRDSDEASYITEQIALLKAVGGVSAVPKVQYQPSTSTITSGSTITITGTGNWGTTVATTGTW